MCNQVFVVAKITGDFIYIYIYVCVCVCDSNACLIASQFPHLHAGESLGFLA